MNWGYKIALVYILFVIGMLTLVYKCTQQKVDLVAENYYEQEVKFQGQYNSMINSNQVENTVVAEKEGATYRITMPEKFKDKTVAGSVVFFRPDNSKLDFNLALKPINGQQEINLANLKQGAWRVKINWTSDAVSFYQEDKLYID
jgi:hypothetical protein